MGLFYRYKSLLLLATSLTLATPLSATELGRLFTSVEDRRQLDEIREAEPLVEESEIIEIEESIEPIAEEKEKIIHDVIRVKGIVHRSDGKNTAWINDTNTFDGDLESQHIKIDDNSIKPDQVQIAIPDGSTRINLKVGESYLPSNHE